MSSRQGIERRRSFGNEARDLILIADQNQNWFVVFPALELFDFLNRDFVERIGAETIERVRAKSNDAAALAYFSGLNYRFPGERNYHSI